MATLNPDLHGNIPDHAPAALLLIDLINDFDFPGGEELLQQTIALAAPLMRLKQEARRRGIPVIYVNDNFGRWRSDFRAQIERCSDCSARGGEVVRQLLPAADDYFVLKPKNSGFFSTVLETLLHYLEVRALLLTGIAGNNCVLFTAQDAYLRDFRLFVPRDCVASIDPQENEHALSQIKTLLKGDVRPSTELDWTSLLASPQEQETGPSVTG